MVWLPARRAYSLERIDSDPELENQINDQWSFKKFIGIPMRQPSPNHSLISKFRKRVSQQVMEAIHSELLKQFSEKGYSIEGGMAIDPRLENHQLDRRAR